MKQMKLAATTAVSIAGVLTLASCEQEPDTPGERLDEGIENAGESLEGAGDEIGDRIEDVGDAIEDAGN